MLLEKPAGPREPSVAEQAAPVAFVTGATGGLGRALVEALSRLNWTLLVHGRHPGKLAELVSDLEAIGARSVTPYLADFGSIHAVDAMCAQIRADQPKIDLLINNAAVGIASQRSLSADGYDRSCRSII